MSRLGWVEVGLGLGQARAGGLRPARVAGVEVGLGWWVISQLGWVEIGMAGVETKLGLVVAVGMVGCGDCDGG